MRIHSLAYPLVCIVLAGAAVAQTAVNFTPFGRPCGGDLAGSLVRTGTGPVVRFDVANAAPNSIAVMVIGQQLPVALPLPNSNCGLLVQPRATLLAQVDGNGAAAFRFPLPPIAPISLDFQAVTIALNRNGRTAESTNGVTLNVR
jgi:hypothetical protein